MSDLPKKIFIDDEGPREGFQIEKQHIPTARKIELIEALAETGLPCIQTMSFVNGFIPFTTRWVPWHWPTLSVSSIVSA